MAWIKLTQLDGNAVYVSADQIVRVRLPVGEAPSAKAVLDFTSGQLQAVHESIDQVMSLLSGDDGDSSSAKQGKKS
jgi:uncharacterized protein YlzI (FlbEa/FlbD family)